MTAGRVPRGLSAPATSRARMRPLLLAIGLPAALVAARMLHAADARLLVRLSIRALHVHHCGAPRLRSGSSQMSWADAAAAALRSAPQVQLKTHAHMAQAFGA